MTQGQKKATVRQAALAERAAYTRRAILDAAEEIFARHGLQGTRVREIASAAGVNVATLYNYYKNKEALYEAVLDQGIQPVTEAIKAVSHNGAGEISTRDIIDTVLNHLRDRPQVSRLIYLEAISEGPFLKKIANKWFRPLLQEISTVLSSDADDESWEENLHPFISALFVHLSFGHFAIAPLLKEVFGSDPLSTQGIEYQADFIEYLVLHMFPGSTSSEEKNPSS